MQIINFLNQWFSAAQILGQVTCGEVVKYGSLLFS
jgi:hypothetical protein